MPNAEVFIRLEGPVERGPTLFYYGEKKDKAVVKFAVPYRFKHKDTIVEQWFNFVAFGRLAEYIATHYVKGSTITVLSARPWRDQASTKWGKRWFQNWVIAEIGAPSGIGPKPKNPDSVKEVDLNKVDNTLDE